MATRLIHPDFPFTDANGAPRASGRIYFYETGTTTPKATFSDSTLTTPSTLVTNAIVLDAEGKLGVDVWGSGEYKLDIHTAADVLTTPSYDPLLGFDLAGVNSVNTYTALAAILKATLTNADVRQVLGQAVKGDIEPVLFEWASASSATANGGTILASGEGGTGRWLMRFTGPILVEWFGPNTTPGTTQMRTIWQAAIDAAETAGITRVLGRAGEVWRIDAGFTYTALSVTENVGIEMKDGVIVDAQGGKFIRAGVAGDTVTNQFWFFGNKVTASTLSDLGVINAVFENDGDANVYVSGVAFFAGDSGKAAGWYRRPVAHNLKGIETRVLVKSYDDDTALTVGKIKGGNYQKLQCVNAGAAVLALQSEIDTYFDDIYADVSDFDIVDIFKGKGITGSNIRGTGVVQYALNCENQQTTGQILEEVTVDGVRADGIGVRVANTGSSTGILRQFSLTGLIVPSFTASDAGTGTVQSIYAQGIFHDSASRAIFVENASDVRIDADAKNPTLAGAQIKNSPDCVLNGTLDLTGITDKNCLELDRANNFRCDVVMIDGDDGLHIIKANGALGGARCKIRARGQNSSPIGKDGSALAVTDRLHVTGDWADQTITFDNIQNTLIELQAGYGDNLTIATGVITVTNQMHVVAAESGTTDDLVTINGGFHGQRLILQPDSGDTITFKHNTGNILMNSAGDVAVTSSLAVELVFDGVINDKWIET